MPGPHEIPEKLTELYQMSKEYLRQETIEPAKRLGKQAAFGIGGAILMALGASLLAWGVYFGMLYLLPEGEWWRVLAKGVTVVAALLGVGLVVWRMQKSDPEVAR